MTEAENTPAARPDGRALLKDLHARFTVLGSHSPLAIGIDKQLLAQEPELDRKALRLALRSHTMSTRYLKEMQTARVRLNLDGSEAGEVTDEARAHAAEQLRERFKKQAEQRRAGEAAAKAAEAAALAEQRRLEKLSLLTEKFGRKQK
jgi:ProP effector